MLIILWIDVTEIMKDLLGKSRENIPSFLKIYDVIIFLNGALGI